MRLVTTLTILIACSLSLSAAWGQPAEKPDPPKGNGPQVTVEQPPGTTVIVKQPPANATPAPVVVQPAPVIAQPPPRDKPNPQPVAAPEPLTIDYLGFRVAYQRAKEPRLLILCGIDTQAIGNGPITAPRVATGHVDDVGHLGAGLAIFDASGDAAMLRSSIEEHLLKNPDVELVHLNALSERDRREISLLDMRDELRAIDLLGAKTNADIVFVIRMISNATVRERGAKWRVMVDMVQVGRGRKIGGFAFDWREALDAYSIKSYAYEITRKLVDQFSGYFGAPGDEAPSTRYTVRMIGVTDANAVIRAREAFMKIPGMEKVTPGEFMAAKGDAVATLLVRFTGSPLELLADLQTAASRELGMEVKGTDAAAGTVTLIASGAADRAPARPRWQLFLDDKDPRSAALRQELVDLYRKQGSPKVAVLMSRELSSDELRDPDFAHVCGSWMLKPAGSQPAAAAGQAGRDGVFVTINMANEAGSWRAPTGAPKDVADAAERWWKRSHNRDGLLGMRRIEDEMSQNLINLGLTVVDPKVVVAKLGTALPDGRGIGDRDEVIRRLAQASGADIVIHGVGWANEIQTKDDKMIAPPVRGYTFRAVRLHDGVILGTTSWSVEDQASRKQDGKVWVVNTELTQSIQRLSAEVSAQMADQFMYAWAPAQALTVNVQNAKTQRDVFDVMNALRAGIPEIDGADFVKHDAAQSLGAFTLRHRLTSADLLKRLGEQEQKLPISLDAAGSNKDSLTVRIK